MPNPQPNTPKPSKHDSHDGAHDEVRFGGKGRDASDDKLGNHQEPDKEEIESVKGKSDSAQFRVCFQRDEQAQQESNWDENHEDQGNHSPGEIAVPYVTEEVEHKDG